MGFLPLIPPDDGKNPPTKVQAKLAIIMGLLVAMLLGFMFLFTSGRLTLVLWAADVKST